MACRLCSGVALAASLTLLASPAYSQTPGRCGEDSDRETLARANALFVRAQDELDAGRAAQAELRAREVLAQQDSPNARLFLGRTLRAQSRWAAAYDQFDRAARDASACAQREPSRRSRYAQTIRAAIEDRDAIAARVGLLSLRPTQAVSTDARVVIDGDERPFASDRPIPVPPGVVRFSFTARGFERIEQQVEVRAGQVTELLVELRAPRLASVPSESTGSRPRIEAQRVASAPSAVGGGAPFAVALSTAALGGVALAAGGIFAGIASTQFQALSSQCGANGCPADASFATELDRGELFERVGVALLITGAIAITTGTIAAIIARPRSRDAQTGVDR